MSTYSSSIQARLMALHATLIQLGPMLVVFINMKCRYGLLIDTPMTVYMGTFSAGHVRVEYV